jgi:hypothetical protein
MPSWWIPLIWFQICEVRGTAWKIDIAIVPMLVGRFQFASCDR